MEKKQKIASPKYHKIAMDIASRIVDGRYQVGDKIYARSSLAGQYGVSSETARRAICILSDLGIVESTKGSGVRVTSFENAVKFIRQYSEIETVNHLKLEIQESVERQAKEIEHLNSCLSKLIEKTDRFRYTNPFDPFEIEITPDTPYLDQTIADVNVWHHTSATIVALKRNGKMLLSPGPYAMFKAKDIVYFVGDENCFERVKSFFYPKNDIKEKI